jgi:hypothetical protein
MGSLPGTLCSAQSTTTSTVRMTAHQRRTHQAIVWDSPRGNSLSNLNAWTQG